MKNLISSKDLHLHVGEHVTAAGYLHHFRALKSVAFLIMRDAKGLLQVVLEDPEQIAAMGNLYHESVLEVNGTVFSAPSVSGGVELHAPTISILSRSTEPPPINLFQPELNAHLPTILDHASLTLRHPRNQAIGRITAASVAAFRDALRAQDFVEIHTPKIVSSASESGANVFALDYFGRKAYLAQSPQMYKQIMVGVHTRVFETAPVFRAEPHATKRHLNEYMSLDMEMGFIDDHRDVMAMLEHVVREMVLKLADTAADELNFLGAKLPLVPERIPIVSFADAKELYFSGTGDDTRSETDLSPDEERYLGSWALSEYKSDFIYVERYPLSKRPFYTHPCPDQPEYSNSFDLIFRGLELVTGGQRLHEYEAYIESLKGRQMNPADFSDYLEIFKYGMPPHGGFGFGLERWVTRLLELDNIREATLFPRDRNRLSP